MKEFVLAIEGMTCVHCVNAMDEIIREVDCVATCEIDLKAAQAKITVLGGEQMRDLVVNHINETGIYQAN